MGSSPRVWGQAFHGLVTVHGDRIIPTRVGTRHGKKPTRSQYEDHPHACGDKSFYRPLGNVIIGSSPRVWGQDIALDKFRFGNRIIPTRVGTSSGIKTRLSQYKDHPHACGDKHSLGNLVQSVPGSSPRVWGQAVYAGTFQRLARIIPTRVGTRP